MKAPTPTVFPHFKNLSILDRVILFIKTTAYKKCEGTCVCRHFQQGENILEPDLRPVTGSHFARPGKSAAAAAITLSTQGVNEHQIELIE